MVGGIVSRRQVLRAGVAVAAVCLVPELSVVSARSAGAAPAGRGLTLASFSPLVGTDFALGGSRLRLVEVVQRPPSVADRSGLTGEAFSLVFGGGPGGRLTDGTYTLTHPLAGPFSLFLVPVGMARQGQRYQAVVDRRTSGR